jgi:hypothetical protein
VPDIPAPYLSAPPIRMGSILGEDGLAMSIDVEGEGLAEVFLLWHPPKRSGLSRLRIGQGFSLIRLGHLRGGFHPPLLESSVPLPSREIAVFPR